MEYRNLGRTGVKVSSLWIPAWDRNDECETDPAESTEIIDRAIDAGINFFDTANVYGDRRQRGDDRRGACTQWE